MLILIQHYQAAYLFVRYVAERAGGWDALPTLFSSCARGESLFTAFLAQRPIAPDLEREYSKLDDSKKNVVGTTEGAVLVVAGPGSGKTFSLVLRTLNLLRLEKAEPGEIILCTFTRSSPTRKRKSIRSSFICAY